MHPILLHGIPVPCGQMVPCISRRIRPSARNRCYRSTVRWVHHRNEILFFYYSRVCLFLFFLCSPISPTLSSTPQPYLPPPIPYAPSPISLPLTPTYPLLPQDLAVSECALRCFASLADRFTRRGQDPAPLATDNLLRHLLSKLRAAGHTAPPPSSGGGGGGGGAQVVSQGV